MVQQLKILKRVKRDFNDNVDIDELNVDAKQSRKPRRKLNQSRRKNRRNRHNRNKKSRRPKNFEDEARYYQNRKTRRSISFNIETGPNDEKYSKMWYLNPNYQCPSNSNQCSKPRNVSNTEIRLNSESEFQTKLKIELNSGQIKVRSWASLGQGWIDSDQYRVGSRSCVGQIFGSINI